MWLLCRLALIALRLEGCDSTVIDLRTAVLAPAQDKPDLIVDTGDLVHEAVLSSQDFDCLQKCAPSLHFTRIAGFSESHSNGLAFHVAGCTV
jgi:hypothetical protein